MISRPRPRGPGPFRQRPESSTVGGVRHVHSCTHRLKSAVLPADTTGQWSTKERTVPKRVIVALCAVAVVVAACGGTEYRQPSPQPPAAASSDELLERLDELERDLPERLLPASFSFAPPITGRTVGPDSIDLERRLDGLEPELRPAVRGGR
jgi:hypothetical protein